MTTQEAIKMIKAKKKCLECSTSGQHGSCSDDCDDCDLNYMQGNMGEQIEWLEIAIKALEEQDKHRWIPCEVEMPKEHEETRDIYDAFTLAFEDTKYFMASELVQVTAIDESGNKFVADDLTENGKWVNFNEEFFDVIAWMPLPEPYKID